MAPPLLRRTQHLDRAGLRLFCRSRVYTRSVAACRCNGWLGRRVTMPTPRPLTPTCTPGLTAAAGLPWGNPRGLGRRVAALEFGGRRGGAALQAFAGGGEVGEHGL